MIFDEVVEAAARRVLQWSLDEDHARDDVTSRQRFLLSQPHRL